MMKEISLSLEYQQAKRNYRASKSSSNAANKENEEVSNASSSAAKIRKSKNRSSIKTTANAVSKGRAAIPSPPPANGAPNGGMVRLKPRRPKSNDDLSPPTKETGLELLGLVRPSDSRAEWGLSSANPNSLDRKHQTLWPQISPRDFIN